MAKEHEIPITIDGKPYKVPEDQNPVTGQILRTMASVSDDYDLWLRGRGREDDRIIEPVDVINLEPGMAFYTAKKHITPGGQQC